MEDKESVGSSICSGSHMHRRVFNPEDPWLSLESTILAGNVTLDEKSSNLNSKSSELSTVPEEKDQARYSSIELELEPIVDDNVLNMNIDAISDDDVFFDCATSPCRSSKKFFDSRSGGKSPRPKMTQSAASRFGRFLTVEDCTIASSSDAADTSSSVGAGQRTGHLLVQIVDDFNDMKDHAQSTPKLDEEDSGYFQLPTKSEDSECSSRERSKGPAAKQRPAVPRRKKNLGRKSPSYKPMSPVDPSNKENYHRGKYSRAVARPPNTPFPRVLLMKQYFESRVLNESQPSQSKPLTQSSSIRYKTTLRKSPRLSDLRSLSSEAETSRKKRSARSRPSSCSEISCTESSASRASTNRSKSTSDATTDSSKEIMKGQRFNNIAIRRYNKPIIQRSTQHVNSPKDSTIKKRRSFGLVVSPIKPVREIRKLFSPRFQESKTDGNKSIKNKPKILKTPRIIYTNEK